MRGAVLLLLALLCPAAAIADSGAEAFERRDFATARALWLEEAEAGDPEAALGLGALSDLGLGVPRDPERAFRYYLTAADAGLAEAQFNVAVMLDSGAVQAGNSGAAALWYGRAAANGYHRAEYNLGIMFETGDGVDRNVDLARIWMSRAGTAIEAANERLADLGPGIAPNFGAPSILGGFRVTGSDAAHAELVWTASLARPGTNFLVQVLMLSPDGPRRGRIVRGVETAASAASIDLPDPDAAYLWRVTRLDRDGRRYAASDWTPLDPDPDIPPAPRAFVTFRVQPSDGDARRLAASLEESLASNGIWSVTEDLTTSPPESSVTFTFDGDRPLAADLAAFLPALTEADLRRADFIGAEPRPGEILVTLVGGLSLG